jgi:hypothetical protein
MSSLEMQPRSPSALETQPRLREAAPLAPRTRVAPDARRPDARKLSPFDVWLLTLTP